MTKHWFDQFGDDRGQAIIFVAVASVVIIGLAAFAVDIGFVLNAHKELQASTDAAATAAAQDLAIPTKTRTQITTTAQNYSAMAGKKNAYHDLTGVSVSTSYICSANVGLPSTCTNTALANTIVVTSTATVPLFLARVLGLTSMALSAKASAVMKGGGPPPLDVVVVLDTTGSMGNSCSGGGTKLDCAKTGIRALLSSLWPCSPTLSSCGSVDSSGNVTNPYDKVGLVIFPPLISSSNVSAELNCATDLSASNVAYDNPADKAHDPNYTYRIVNLSSDYKASATASALVATSNLVKSVQTGSCGVENPAGAGSSFATAIEAAQAELDANGRSTVQDVIIFVSDGEANYGPVYKDSRPSSPETSPYRTQPCHQAITSADSYASRTTMPTWIYAIAYDSSGNCTGWSTSDTFHFSTANTSTSGFSNNESPTISGVSAMTSIASDSTKFYNQPSAASLTAIFQRIGNDLMTTRIIDDSTP